MIKPNALVLSSILLIFGSMVARAATEQPDYKLLNRIAACRSVRCLSENKSSVKDKTARMVLYTNWLILEPGAAEASKQLLVDLPTTELEVMLLATLPDWHDGATTSRKQMQRLDRVYRAWPRLLSVGVRRWPEFLPACIRYGRLAISDIHSDFTGFERGVCRANPRRFRAAFLSLNAEDQAYLRNAVFDPDGCKPIFLSEAEK
jgi:hypothetical protein